MHGEQFVARQLARFRGAIGRVGDDASQLLIEFFECAAGLPDAGARLVQRGGRFGGDFGFESRQFTFGQGGQGVLQLHQDAARIRGLLSQKFLRDGMGCLPFLRTLGGPRVDGVQRQDPLQFDGPVGECTGRDVRAT